ncbi:type II toxin-antitoxin system CcdA family antitoxin [Acetobacter persici]|uniref:type II toxin-antitoxin system CcdA family antitoxin n=1 Tax=Acetobacter persici TaxID=1076596 RepID=UPI0039ED4346
MLLANYYSTALKEKCLWRYLNISQACEQGLKSAIASVRAQQWLAENRSSLEASRQYVEENGLPLADCRNF